ncbi:MAG: hypothetical protein JSV62_14610 [Promethearchaeota archaeon]|nr:MAG: hypothetical protein JSV62_14610 [Candidatus Lokiarchaeota archaeon]
MSDIYVPIDFSDLKSVIPPGEDIIYSTLARGETPIGTTITGSKVKYVKYISHILMTPNGVAYTVPTKKPKKEPPVKRYTPWGEIHGIASAGKLGTGFSISLTLPFKLVREENFETKESFEKRSKEFVAKFRPLIIEKKEEWLRQNRNNPEIKKREIKMAEKVLAKMKSWENKRLAKEAKKK